jgi:hypothetical protein
MGNALDTVYSVFRTFIDPSSLITRTETYAIMDLLVGSAFIYGALRLARWFSWPGPTRPQDWFAIAMRIFGIWRLLLGVGAIASGDFLIASVDFILGGAFILCGAVLADFLCPFREPPPAPTATTAPDS